MTDQQDRGNLKRERKKRKHVEAKKIRLLGRKKGKKRERGAVSKRRMMMMNQASGAGQTT